MPEREPRESQSPQTTLDKVRSFALINPHFQYIQKDLQALAIQQAGTFIDMSFDQLRDEGKKLSLKRTDKFYSYLEEKEGNLSDNLLIFYRHQAQGSMRKEDAKRSTIRHLRVETASRSARIEFAKALGVQMKGGKWSRDVIYGSLPPDFERATSFVRVAVKKFSR